jgi:C1A family cysteine protease
MLHSKYALGWIPDLPDHRDYTFRSEILKKEMDQMGMGELNDDIPSSVDLRKWCSPIEDQTPLNSCTAHAGTNLLEYFMIKTTGKYINGSRLFLYKATRNLLGDGDKDKGSFLRTTMGAMRLFGICPEPYWTYDPKKVLEEPPAFCYSFAENYKALKYFSLDPANATTNDTLTNVKNFLAAGLTSMFGFTVFKSIDQARDDGKIPMPSSVDNQVGGHAMHAVGYDDNIKITNEVTNEETTGAILFENSWGTEWGDNGFGYLPYEYIRNGDALDFWSLVESNTVNNLGDFFGQ